MFHLTRPRVLVSKAIQVACITLAIIAVLLSLHRIATRRLTLQNLTDPNPSTILAADGDHVSLTSLYKSAPKYVTAIMNPDDETFSRLKCPAPRLDRYEYLQRNPKNPKAITAPKFFFALNLHQCAEILPRLIGSIVETIRFLGPENCALSIVEGRSNDGTFEILDLLRQDMDIMALQYHLSSSPTDPTKIDRIAALANLRNLALEPLTKHVADYSKETTVIFLNDVAICMEDILELIHQRVYQEADMTCAMDWVYVGVDPTFYDVWIARGMNGDTFFNIPEDGSWDSAWNIFWNNPQASEGYVNHRPFQVFACWNGATVFTATPFIEKKLAFRHAKDNECYQGEPKLFCKDMWHQGYGKIAVVPSVNIEYSDVGTQKIKNAKGYTSQWVSDENSNRIEWQKEPPATVKCMRGYQNQTWVPWNEGLS